MTESALAAQLRSDIQRSGYYPDLVADALETALAGIANEPVSVTCAGRTDRGVHALLDQPVGRDRQVAQAVMRMRTPGPWSRAFTPVPATVEILPSVPTFLIRWLAESAMKTFPSASSATSCCTC